MLENEQCPGWLYEVNKGATTIWEGWDAIDPKTGRVKAKSLNHYSPGAAMSWLWTRCCGIRPTAPGYKKIEIAPQPGGTFTYAKASYDSVSGKIVSSWEKEDGEFILDVEIPSQVDATVILPDGTVIKNAVTGTFICNIEKKGAI
jgi:alpha-L-rhamnosidase